MRVPAGVLFALLLASVSFAQAPAAVDWDKETAALLDKVVSDNTNLSVIAYDEILDYGRPCVPALRAALKDAKPAKRYFAAELLGRIHDPAAAPDLLALLEDGAEERTGESVAVSAARALGRLADPSVGDKLIEKLDSTDINLRYEAARALGLLRVGKAEAKLIEILKKGETAETFGGGLMTAACIEALGRLRSEAAVMELKPYLEKTAPETRSGWTLQQLTVMALERISGETKGAWDKESERGKTVEAWNQWIAGRKPVEVPK